MGCGVLGHYIGGSQTGYATVFAEKACLLMNFAFFSLFSSTYSNCIAYCLGVLQRIFRLDGRHAVQRQKKSDSARKAAARAGAGPGRCAGVHPWMRCAALCGSSARVPSPLLRGYVLPVAAYLP